MKYCLFLLLFAVLVHDSTAQEKRNFLQNEAEQINLEQNLITNFGNLNLPDYTNRSFWEDLPAVIRNQYIDEAEEYLDYDWPVVKATDYLEIIRSGDRRQEVYAAPRSALLALVMGELTEGEGRFLDDIINGVWYYSEQTWWGWSAHLTAQKAPHGLPDAREPVIDLGVGEITNILSWTWYLFKNDFDEIHPLIATRLKDEIMNKAVIPYYEREDFWWMGLDGTRSVNNWNPWTNHNMLTAILILEDDPVRKLEGVQKVIRSLDVFVNGYPADGGCDEGPSYWGRAGASLYQCLDLLQRATGGAFDIYDNQLIRNMGSYIYKAYIDYPYFLNFADADATTDSRPGIIYRYGKSIKDPTMWKFGAFLAKKQDWGTQVPGGKIDEQIMNLMYMGEITSASAENALISDFYLPETGIGGARDKTGTADGFYFAAKGGHNAESHNHNDLGSCVLYYNGQPALIDVGRERYTAKTFSSRRYEIWTMQSAYHNVPTINGVEQHQGRQYEAKITNFTAGDSKVLFSMDIAGAYPEEASVDKWIRSYKLDRGEQFTIRDDWKLKVHDDSSTALNFISYCTVKKLDPGTLEMKGNGFSLQMHYDPEVFSSEVQFIEVTDDKLQQYWPDGVSRIVFTYKDMKSRGTSEIVVDEGG